MANTKSAIKRVRRISRQTIVNRSRKSKFRSLLLDKDFEPAKNLQLEELTEDTCKYMEGHPDDPKISDSLNDLKKQTEKLDILGVYPASSYRYQKLS